MYFPNSTSFSRRDHNKRLLENASIPNRGATPHQASKLTYPSTLSLSAFDHRFPAEAYPLLKPKRGPTEETSVGSVDTTTERKLVTYR
jgi:hypothetical protein